MSGSGRGQLHYSRPCPPPFATAISQRVSLLRLGAACPAGSGRHVPAGGKGGRRTPALRSLPLRGHCNLPSPGHGEGPDPRSPPRNGAAASAGEPVPEALGRGRGAAQGPGCRGARPGPGAASHRADRAGGPCRGRSPRWGR